MTSPDTDPKVPLPEDQELTFGETARFRSETLLQSKGKPGKGEYTGKIVYSWKVGWDWWKKFTLSRPDVPMVAPDTIYSLEYKDLAGHDDGQYDFSSGDGLNESSKVSNRGTIEYLANQLSGSTGSETHQEIVLDYLNSAEVLERDGPGF